MGVIVDALVTDVTEVVVELMDCVTEMFEVGGVWRRRCPNRLDPGNECRLDSPGGDPQP